jgi:glycosyltransferase involved in cell wall biosynthesis
MAEKPTLLLIGPTPPPYHGVSMAMQTLLTSSITETFRVVHLDIADRRGIQHVDRPDFYDIFLFLRQWTKVLGILVLERPSLFYLPLSQSTIGFLRDSFFLWSALLLGSRLVIHLHGSHLRQWYETRSPLLKAYVRWTLQRVTKFVILGESLRPLFEGLVPVERIAVVPNGVPWNPTPVCAPSGSRKERKYRVLHLSTLCRQKGALVVLEAIPFIIRRRRDVEFVFAGAWLRDEDRNAAETWINREGLEAYVTFTGTVAGIEKQNLYHSADLFVFPGIQPEGQPLVLLEAMAAGLPILFTDWGCIRETVIDGENGLKVGIGDSEDLAKKILMLLDRPETMQEMSKQSRHRYESCYTDAHFRRKMVDVINQAWEGRGK